MKITVTRDIFTNQSTTSTVRVDGIPFCFALEDVDRKLECNSECKVDGETAIPRGTYRVIVDYSQRFQTLMPHVLDVPGFEGIRIHPGNSAVDTHGCLLLSLGRGPDRVTNSRAAYNSFMTLIESALDRDGKIDIEYV